VPHQHPLKCLDLLGGIRAFSYVGACDGTTDTAVNASPSVSRVSTRIVLRNRLLTL
jgi:hypothetical protein